MPDAKSASISPNAETRIRHLEEALQRNTRLFEAMLSHSRDGIVLTGPDGRIVRIVRSIAGYGPTDMAGAPVESLVHPDDRETVHDCYRRLLNREATSLSLEARVLRPDGSCFWAEATLTDMLDVPEVQAIVGNYSDVTARRNHELALAEFEAMVRHANYAVFSKDTLGQILTWNQGAERMFGYTAEEIVGKHIHVLVPQESLEEESANRKRVIETGEAIEFRTERAHKDGSHILIDLQLVPVLDSAARVRGLVHISRPVR